MDFSFNTQETNLISAVKSASRSLNIHSYIVGGYVRDRLINRPTNDIDIVCIGDAILVAQKVSEILNVPSPVYFKNFGTAQIKFHELIIEFVGARKESYVRESRKPAVEAGTIEDDQNRRDFTINAMAISLTDDSQNEIIDPFGGLVDLENQIIRTPLEPDKTYSDDPLRMMRAIRFASQLGFKIDESSFEGIERNCERINIVSQERISGELEKIILSPRPSIGFEYLHQTGLLPLIFPEMVALVGVDYVDGKGHKDNFYHTLEVLDNVSIMSKDLWLRWAAILHDIGKPPTKRFDRKAGWTFHGHETVGARMVPKIFKRMRLPLDHKMQYVRKLVQLHLRPISLTKEDITDSAVRRLLFEAGEDVEDLMILCHADVTTKNENKKNRYRENFEMVKEMMTDIEAKDHLRNWEPPIDGELIMKTFNLNPSRLVGDIKTAIREAILDGDIENNYDAAYEFMLNKAEKLGVAKPKN